VKDGQQWALAEVGGHPLPSDYFVSSSDLVSDLDKKQMYIFSASCVRPLLVI
jgi:hypothetical protein